MKEITSKGIEFIQSLDSFAGVKRRFVIRREDAETSEDYGKIPYMRDVKELLRFGIINLDKPPGPTSHEVVAWIKKLLNLRRAGHGGTLEPP